MAGEIKKVQRDDGVAFDPVTDLAIGGGGSGEINWAADSDVNVDGEVNDFTSWPTQGSASVTQTTTAGQVLRGAASIKLSATASGNAKITFDVPEGDENKLSKVQFDYKSLGSYASGDITMNVIFDPSGVNQQLTTQNNSINAGQGLHIMTFATREAGEYQVVFVTAATDGIAIDNLIVGPGLPGFGAVVGPWISYSPTIGGTSGNGTVAYTTQDGRYRRVGDSMEIEFWIRLSTVTVAPTGNLTVSLPSGFSASNTGLNPSVPFGEGSYTDTAASPPELGLVFFYNDTESVVTTFVSSTQPTPVSDDRIRGTLTVPIAEWADSGVLHTFKEQNLTEWSGYTPTTAWTTSPTTKQFYQRRVGDSLEVTGFMQMSGAVSTTITITLPSGLTIDSNKAFTGTGATDASVFGVAHAFDAGGAHYQGSVIYDGTSSVRLRPEAGGSTPWNAAVPFTWANNDRLGVTFKVPIAEWANQPSPLVGFAMAGADRPGLLEYYDEDTVAVDNTFTAGNLVLTRVGNVVTITADQALTHSSSSAPSTSSGLIPAAFRPSDTIHNVYSVGASVVRYIVVQSNGTYSITYRDWSGTLLAQTTTDTAPSVTYLVT